LSKFQNENSDLFRVKILLETIREIDSQLSEGLLREQTPLEANSTLHGEADQELLNYQRKTLRKLKRTYLKTIDQIISS
jgi:hypothetical protein